LVVQANQKAREEGADYHPTFQQIAFVDTETGELQERRLDHPEAAEKFYRELAAQGKKVREGMEASGHARWFERLLAELCRDPQEARTQAEDRSPERTTYSALAAEG
jgi:hypothetical protein